MDTLPIWIVERVFPPVVIEDKCDFAIGTPGDLSTDSRSLVELAIRLPTVNEPGLNLQFVGWEDLDSKPVEEPGSVGGNKRGLVGPIIKIVKTPQPDV